MLKFRFYRIEEGPMDGFDLGHMSVLGEQAEADSRTPPPRSFMIYLALVDLLLGVRELLQGKKKHFEFVAADSSYILDFWRRAEGISIKGRGRLLGVFWPEEVYSALLEGVIEFLKGDPSLLERDGSHEREIRWAWDAFRNIGRIMPTRG